MKRRIIILFTIFIIISCTENKIESEKNRSVDSNYISIHKAEKLKNSTQQSFEITVDSIFTINDSLNIEFFTPKFTMDGKKIISTTSNFSELWMYDLENKKFKNISSENGCGQYFYTLNFMNAVVYRVKSFSAKKRNYELKFFDLDTWKDKLIYSSSLRLTNILVNGNEVYFLENEQPKCIDIVSRSIKESPDKPFYFIKDNKLFRYKNKVEEVKLPNEEYEFVGSKVSFDGNTVFILTKNHGVIALDINGSPQNIFSSAISITKLNKSNLVAIYSQEDDGKQIFKTKLSIGFTNSTNKIEIPFPEQKLIFDPMWSPVDNILVYTNNQNKLELLKFSIQ